MLEESNEYYLAATGSCCALFAGTAPALPCTRATLRNKLQLEVYGLLKVCSHLCVLRSTLDRLSINIFWLPEMEQLTA